MSGESTPLHLATQEMLQAQGRYLAVLKADMTVALMQIERRISKMDANIQELMTLVPAIQASVQKLGTDLAEVIANAGTLDPTDANALGTVVTQLQGVAAQITALDASLTPPAATGPSGTTGVTGVPGTTGL